MYVPTWQIREHEDALVEAKGHEVLPELLEDGQSHKEGEGAVAKKHGVPQMVDLVQGEDVWNDKDGQYVLRLALCCLDLRVNMVRNQGMA